MGNKNDVDKLLKCMGKFKSSVLKLSSNDITFKNITNKFEDSFKEYIHSRSKILFRTNRVLSQIYDKLKKYNNETMDTQKINDYIDLLKIQGKTSIKSGATIDSNDFLIKYYSDLSEMAIKLKHNYEILEKEGQNLIDKINKFSDLLKQYSSYNCEKVYEYTKVILKDAKDDLKKPILDAAKNFGFNSKINDYEYICSEEQLNKEMEKLDLKGSNLPLVYSKKNFENAYKELKQEIKAMYSRGIECSKKSKLCNSCVVNSKNIGREEVCGYFETYGINPYLSLRNATNLIIKTDNNCKYTIKSDFNYPFVFLGSPKLKKIRFSGGTLEKIEDSAFNGLSGLEEVTFQKISDNIDEENLKKFFNGKKIYILGNEKNDIFLNSIEGFIKQIGSINYFYEIPNKLSKCLTGTKEELKKPILKVINEFFGDKPQFFDIESFNQKLGKLEIRDSDDLPPIYKDEKFKKIYEQLKCKIRSKVERLIKKFEQSISYQTVSINSDTIDNSIINHIKPYKNYPEEMVYKNIKSIYIDMKKESYTIKSEFNLLSNSFTNLQEIYFSKTLNCIEKDAFKNFKNLKRLIFYKISNNVNKEYLNNFKKENIIIISVYENDLNQQKILECISELINNINNIKKWSDYYEFFDQQKVGEYLNEIKEKDIKEKISNELIKFGAMAFVNKKDLEHEIKGIFTSKFEKTIKEKYEQLISAIESKGTSLIEQINNDLQSNYQIINIDSDRVNSVNVLGAANKLHNRHFIYNATKIKIISTKKTYNIEKNFNCLAGCFKNLQEIYFSKTLNCIEKDAFKNFENLKKLIFEKIADNVELNYLNSIVPNSCKIVVENENKKTSFSFFKRKKS